MQELIQLLTKHNAVVTDNTVRLCTRYRSHRALAEAIAELSKAIFDAYLDNIVIVGRTAKLRLTNHVPSRPRWTNGHGIKAQQRHGNPIP